MHLTRFIIALSLAGTGCSLARDSAGPAAAAADKPSVHRSHRATPASRPVTRTYYIAADEVMWDYAPTGMNLTEGRPFNDDEKLYMEVGKTVIGRKVKKAIYRGYTDGTFTQLSPRPREWQHLGMLGPLIRATVGDTVRVVFRNNTQFKASVHPHNVLYEKESEGALYGDGTSGAAKADDGVPPGGTYTYIWTVPERAGPSEHEGSSIPAMYHSHTDEVRDVASGLFGPMIITRRGMGREDAPPIDVDREFVTVFMVVDENSSWYVDENVRTIATDGPTLKVRMGRFFNMAAGPDPDRYFRDTVNGYTFGHVPELVMKTGERVRWHLMASTNIEFHTPHWHGNVATINHMRTDIASVMSMGMVVADMIPDNPGKWLFHCHVANHMRAGMSAMYVVEDANPRETPTPGVVSRKQ
jgi:manganese oxidase